MFYLDSNDNFHATLGTNQHLSISEMQFFFYFGDYYECLLRPRCGFVVVVFFSSCCSYTTNSIILA